MLAETRNPPTSLSVIKGKDLRFSAFASPPPLSSPLSPPPHTLSLRVSTIATNLPAVILDRPPAAFDTFIRPLTAVTFRDFFPVCGINTANARRPRGIGATRTQGTCRSRLIDGWLGRSGRTGVSAGAAVGSPGRWCPKGAAGRSGDSKLAP